ncbi:MAG: stage IV sporulation protein A [Clostridia bacterium]|nr:stage IV sporulation protein A [Clostridia bacterium]
MIMNLYEDIAKRTNGEIYLGIVGPVRSGKSTFVKRFMDSIVIPNIEEGYNKERATDETPQSASGRTIMTTEPKFIPDEAVAVRIGDSKMKVRLIDCVGYMVEGAIGDKEDGKTRMVMTPWDKEPMEFERAAEIGTQRVIKEHSTVGIVVTTDGTIGEIPRESYIPAEERVIQELKAHNKPFVIVLNSSNPSSSEAQELALSLEERYGSTVALVNALELTQEDFDGIIELLLGQFNINEIKLSFPKYLSSLEKDHWLWSSLLDTCRLSLNGVSKIDDIKCYAKKLEENENVYGEPKVSYDLGSGEAIIEIELLPQLYYNIMSEICGIDIKDDEELFLNIKSLSEIKKEFDKYKEAIDEVNATGYGIVLPSAEDMTLSEPETMKQSGSYGIKIKTNAPSIHMIKADIEAEVSPIVGTLEQAQEITRFMLEEYEEDPKHLWEFNMLGKSLYELVSDSLGAKLSHITKESRTRLSDTLTRVINEGSNGLICIIL